MTTRLEGLKLHQKLITEMIEDEEQRQEDIEYENHMIAMGDLNKVIEDAAAKGVDINRLLEEAVDDNKVEQLQS